MTKTVRIDPDPWVVATLLITTVGVVGQLSFAAYEHKQRSIDKIYRSKIYRETLKDDIHNVIRSVEKLTRSIASFDGLEFDVLTRPYRFGETSMLIDRRQLIDYVSHIDMLSMEIGRLNHHVIDLMLSDREFAEQVGKELLNSFRDLSDRINGFQRNQSIGQVFDECLLMLREFERILIRLENEN